MQRVGSRAQVMHGNAKMTGGGLKKKDLKYNKQGKIVSKKMSTLAKKKLQKAGYTTKKGQVGAVRSMRGGSGNNYKNNCLEWAEKGECHNNPKYMHKNCKDECCKVWAERGECGRNPDYMDTQCKDECNKYYVKKVSIMTAKDIIYKVRDKLGNSTKHTPLQDAVFNKDVGMIKFILERYKEILNTEQDHTKSILEIINEEIYRCIKNYNELKRYDNKYSEDLLISLKKGECKIINSVSSSDLSIFKKIMLVPDYSTSGYRLLRYAIKQKREDIVKVICDIYKSKVRMNKSWIFFDIFTGIEFCEELKIIEPENTTDLNKMKKILYDTLDKTKNDSYNIYNNLFHIIKNISQYGIFAHGVLDIIGDNGTITLSPNTFNQKTFEIPENIFIGVLTESTGIVMPSLNDFHPSASVRIYLPKSRILKIKLDFKLHFLSKTYSYSGIFNIKETNLNSRKELIEQRNIGNKNKNNITIYNKSKFNLLNHSKLFGQSGINKSKKQDLEEILKIISESNPTEQIFVLLASCRYGNVKKTNSWINSNENEEENSTLEKPHGIKILPSMPYLDQTSFNIIKDKELIQKLNRKKSNDIIKNIRTLFKSNSN